MTINIRSIHFRVDNKLQEFIDDYPNSEYKNEANAQISELRTKLAYKEYATGILYIKMEEYPSAIISFEYLIDNYYDTEVLEKGHIEIIRCYILMDDLKKAENHYNNHSSEKYVYLAVRLIHLILGIY